MRKLISKMRRGVYIYKYKSLPHGVDFVRDITRYFPEFRADVVFDIGANVGQSAEDFLKKFSEARIFCFEPVSDTFRRLCDNYGSNPRVHCYRMAFGSSKDTGEMVLQGESVTCYLLNKSNLSANSMLADNVATESVDIITLDEFCNVNNIDHISYLKIDTEGGDLEVLKGAVNMLTEKKIDFVQVEAGMNPGNKRHVPFELLKAFLEANGYFLFGIYEQKSEKRTRQAHLRRTNPVFISERILKC